MAYENVPYFNLPQYLLFTNITLSVLSIFLLPDEVTMNRKFTLFLIPHNFTEKTLNKPEILRSYLKPTFLDVCFDNKCVIIWSKSQLGLDFIHFVKHPQPILTCLNFGG